MGKKKCLIVEESARTDVNCSEGSLCRAIAVKITGSDNCVSNYLIKPSTCVKNYKGNCSSALTLRETRIMLRITLSSALSRAKISHKTNETISNPSDTSEINKLRELAIPKLEFEINNNTANIQPTVKMIKQATINFVRVSKSEKMPKLTPISMSPIKKKRDKVPKPIKTKASKKEASLNKQAIVAKSNPPEDAQKIVSPVVPNPLVPLELKTKSTISTIATIPKKRFRYFISSEDEVRKTDDQAYKRPYTSHAFLPEEQPSKKPYTPMEPELETSITVLEEVPLTEKQTEQTVQEQVTPREKVQIENVYVFDQAPSPYVSTTDKKTNEMLTRLTNGMSRRLLDLNNELEGVVAEEIEQLTPLNLSTSESKTTQKEPQSKVVLDSAESSVAHTNSSTNDVPQANVAKNNPPEDTEKIITPFVPNSMVLLEFKTKSATIPKKRIRHFISSEDGVRKTDDQAYKRPYTSHAVSPEEQPSKKPYTPTEPELETSITVLEEVPLTEKPTEQTVEEQVAPREEVQIENVYVFDQAPSPYVSTTGKKTNEMPTRFTNGMSRRLLDLTSEPEVVVAEEIEQLTPLNLSTSESKTTQKEPQSKVVLDSAESSVAHTNSSTNDVPQANVAKNNPPEDTEKIITPFVPNSMVPLEFKTKSATIPKKRIRHFISSEDEVRKTDDQAYKRPYTSHAVSPEENPSKKPYTPTEPELETSTPVLEEVPSTEKPTKQTVEEQVAPLEEVQIENTNVVDRAPSPYPSTTGKKTNETPTRFTNGMSTNEPDEHNETNEPEGVVAEEIEQLTPVSLATSGSKTPQKEPQSKAVLDSAVSSVAHTNSSSNDVSRAGNVARICNCCTCGVMDPSKYRLVTIEKDATSLFIDDNPKRLVRTSDHLLEQEALSTPSHRSQKMKQIIIYYYKGSRREARRLGIEYISNNDDSEDESSQQAVPFDHVNGLATKDNALDETVLKNCIMCAKFIQPISTPDSSLIPSGVFERNRGDTEFKLFNVAAPKTVFPPRELIDDSKYYELYYRDQKMRYTRIHGDIAFKYPITKATNNRFFAIYRQNKQLHLCHYRDASAIRKSEFHRNVNTLKKLPSSRHFRIKDTKPYIIFYSYTSDLYIEFPQDDFFKIKKQSKDFSKDSSNGQNEEYSRNNGQKKKRHDMKRHEEDSSENNEKTKVVVLRVRMSSKTEFNYVLTNMETIKNAKIFNVYYCEQTYLGKQRDADEVLLENITDMDSAVIHCMNLPKKKITSYTPMQYARYRSLKIPLKEFKKTLGIR